MDCGRTLVADLCFFGGDLLRIVENIRPRVLNVTRESVSMTCDSWWSSLWRLLWWN